MKRAAPLALLAGLTAVLACTPTPRTGEIRLGTDSYLMTVTSDPMPPHARERTRYRIVVRDRETRQPLEGGEGRVFGSSRDGASVWDGLARAQEPGTYTGTVSFVTAGEWAVAVQFRRDSTRPLERIDWMQDVMAEREEFVSPGATPDATPTP